MTQEEPKLKVKLEPAMRAILVQMADLESHEKTELAGVTGYAVRTISTSLGKLKNLRLVRNPADNEWHITSTSLRWLEDHDLLPYAVPDPQENTE